MIRDMMDAPRDGSHFLALERVGIENTSKHVLEWREIWYQPGRAFFGPTVWRSVAGAAQFGEDCFAGWMPLPAKPASLK